MKIFVADDHALVREGIIKLLELTREIYVVGSADSGLECINNIAKCEPDIVLLDISLPDINGIEVLKKIKTEHPQVKVIMLTVHDDYAFLQESVSSGADGYVLKDAELDILIEAIHAVSEGETFIQPSLKNMLSKSGEEKRRRKSRGVLTKREYQILNLIANGYSNRNISDELELSEKTVKNHLSNIFKKLNVTDRTQAAIHAIKNNLFSDIK